MTDSQIFFLLISYLVFTCGSLLVWRSKNNTLAILEVPFFFTAYCFPLLVFPYDSFYSGQSIDRLVYLNSVGAVFYLLGCFVGFRLAKNDNDIFSWGAVEDGRVNFELVQKKILIFIAIGVAGMAMSYAWMGMTPAFAEDPFSAKFFKGDYKDKYDQISVIYRFSQFILITILPICFSLVFDFKSKLMGILAVCAMAMLALSLTRAPVLKGLLLCIAVFCSSSKTKTLIFVVASTCLYLAGSALYWITGLTEGGDQIAETILSGAPDIFDHLTFIENFEPERDATYGLTFFGGLVPGSFEYNPSIFSLSISNPLADISEIRSGGFRMPASIWGYAAFPEVGPILVSAFSGLLLGIYSKKLRNALSKSTRLTTKVINLTWFQAIPYFFINFFVMPYFGLISIVVYCLLVGKMRFWRSRRNVI